MRTEASDQLHGDLIVIDAAQYSNWDRPLFEEILAGGITAVNVTLSYWEDARATLTHLGQWKRRFRELGDLIMPVTLAADIKKAKLLGKIGILLAAQNASPIDDDLALVAVMRELGLVCMQLTYNNQNLIGAGCYEAEDAGISRFGREVIREMNRVGMIIDLSHSAERTSLEAIELSSRPVAITHANPSFWYPGSVRNKSSDVLRALAAKGGMLGFSLYPLHLRGRSDCTLADFCQMAAATADLIGIDHIGIGSDMCRNWPYEVVEWMRNGRWTFETNFGEGAAGVRAWPRQPDWFQTPADMPNITAGLLAYGFSENDVVKIMGENWLRFLAEGLEPQ